MKTADLITLFIVLSAIKSSNQQQRTDYVPYLGTGYDLKVGNPEGYSLFRDDSDPGLKATKHILQPDTLGSSSCPIHATCANLQGKKVREYIADDLIKYYRQIQDRWANLEEDDNLNSSCSNALPKPLNVAGGCNSMREVRMLLSDRKDAMLTKETSKIYKEARLHYKSQRFSLNPDFARHLTSLPKNWTEETRSQFTYFFQSWGTHVIVEVALGEKEIQRRLFHQNDYLESFILATGDQSITVSSDYNSYYIPYITEELMKATPYQTYSFVSGSREFPAPLHFHLEPLSSFINEEINLDMSPSEVSDLREKMSKAMRDYLLSAVENEPTFTVRQIPNYHKWPRGTYGLPKTREPCPRHWLYGRRIHDSEDDTSYTSYHKDWKTLVQESGQNVVFQFCTLTENLAAVRKWNRGSYCVFRYGNECPRSFNDAEIFIDDEDNGNQNKVNGTLPDGTYYQDTMYRLCCRDDGITAERPSMLFLPNELPLVLVPVNPTCQRVFGMTSQLMWVNVDYEGKSTSKSFCSGSPPPYCENGPHNTLKIFFCYYKPMAELSHSSSDYTY